MDKRKAEGKGHMLRKVSNFIVDKRIFLLVLLLAITVVSAVGWFFVDVNDDMTKYLPDDSNMKVGMDIMNDVFPEIEMSNTIRVMFDDLSSEEKATVLEKISAIEYVDSVDHDPDSVSYNKDNHTLFVINMSCDYGSEEEKAIEDALKTQFAEYTMIWQNDEAIAPGIPVVVYIVVMIIAIIILCIMCSSWIEPFMILFVQMRKDQPLPIRVQAVLGKTRIKNQSRSLRLGLQQQLNLCIMSERLEMSDADHFSFDLFLIEDFSRVHFATDSETFPDHPFEQIDLNLTHQCRFDLS